MGKTILCKQETITYKSIEITYQIFHIRIVYYGCAYIKLPHENKIILNAKNEQLNIVAAENDINEYAKSYIDNFIEYITNIE